MGRMVRRAFISLPEHRAGLSIPSFLKRLAGPPDRKAANALWAEATCAASGTGLKEPSV